MTDFTYDTTAVLKRAQAAIDAGDYANAESLLDIAIEDATAAINRLSDKPGFRNAYDGFEVTEYVLGKDHWTEGYITQVEALQKQEH